MAICFLLNYFFFWRKWSYFTVDCTSTYWIPEGALCSGSQCTASYYPCPKGATQRDCDMNDFLVSCDSGALQGPCMKQQIKRCLRWSFCFWGLLRISWVDITYRMKNLIFRKLINQPSVSIANEKNVWNLEVRCSNKSWCY